MYASNNFSILKYSNNPGISNSPPTHFCRKQQAVPQLQYKNQPEQKGRMGEKKTSHGFMHITKHRE